MTTIGIVQARFASSRLPGKVLQPIGEVSMLEKVLLRLRRSEEIDHLVLATTTDSSDDPVASAAQAFGATVVRGNQFDVLDRFHTVLTQFPATDVVVRVTADCPFVDPDIVDQLVRRLREGGHDFVSNRLPPPYLRSYPIGLDVEVCTAAALTVAWREAVLAFEREHVMPFLYGENSRFNVFIEDLPEDLSRYRWTVDTPEDLDAARQLDALCGAEPFGWRRVLDVARAHPGLTEINRSGIQKDVTEVDARWRNNHPDPVDS